MKQLRLFLSILFCSWGCGLHTNAQAPRLEDLKFKNYTPSTGLPSDFIETITQDKFGFIWFGTHNGLVRYDGTAFTHFQHDPLDTNSLPINDVSNLAADPTGKCWIASRKGLWYFDYGRNAFHQLKIFSGHALTWASGVSIDSVGSLWFLSNLGVCRYDCLTGAQSVIPVPLGRRPRYTASSFYCTRTGSIWLFDSAGLYRLNRVSSRFYVVPMIPSLYREIALGIRAVFESSDNVLWIASYSGFYRYGLTDHKVTKIEYDYLGVRDSSISISGFDLCPPLTGDSILWCSTPYQGLVVFNLRKQQFTGRFLQDPYDATSLGGSLCYNSYLDHSGILWIAQINGVTKLDWRDQLIKSYRIRQMVDSNRLVPIRRMLRDPSFPFRFWLITWNYGALYYDKATNQVLKQYKKTGGKTAFDISALYDGIFDPQGVLWVATERGLCYYDAKVKQFIACPVTAAPSNGSLVISRMVYNGSNQLVLGTEAGLWIFSLADKTYQPYPFTAGPDSMLRRSAVYALCYDRQGGLYVGTRYGLYVVDTATHRMQSLVRPQPVNATDFNINYTWGLSMDAAGRLWVATRGGGLYRYDPVNKQYRDYPVGNGLTTEELRDVYVDSLNRVWVSSYEGIFMLNPRTGHFTRYGPEDGLDNLNLSLGRWTILDHKIYSGSPGAYSIIDPYAPSGAQNTFPVWITGMRTDKRFLHFNPDSTASHAQILSPEETNLSIEFAALSFTASEKNLFSYRLSGVDKDWQDAGNQSSANYHNLAPGRYLFQVRAFNATGRSSTVIAGLPLILRPPFWKTGLFWMMLFILATGVVWFIVSRRIAAIRQSATQQQQQAIVRQQLAEMEMMALRTQMNPHFIFNCMNIMDALVTDDRKEEAQHFIQQFSRLLRLVLENSAHPLVSLRSELEALTIYTELEVMRQNQSFGYQFSIDPALEELSYRLPPMLLQPYVENAIVHGLRHREQPGGHLRLSMELDSEEVLVSIEDNGIGRAKSLTLNQKNRMAHQPVALRLTRKRMELLQRINGTGIGVFIEDLESGTRVKLRLPLHFTMV